MVRISQIKALLKKNFILTKRNWKGLVLEILIPFIILIILFALRKSISKEKISGSTFTGSMKEINLPLSHGNNLFNCTEYGPNSKLGIFPNDNITQSISAYFPNASLLKYFSSKKELDDYYFNPFYNTKNRPPLCFSMGYEKVNEAYKVYIRFNTSSSIDEIYETLYDPTNNMKVDMRKEFIQFYSTGFYSILNIFSMEIGKQKLNKSVNFKPKIESIKVPEHYSDDFPRYFTYSLQLFIILPLIIPFLRNVKAIIFEKESKMKEGMLMMGLTESSFALSWIIHYFFVYLVISILSTIFLVNTLFPNSNGFIFFCFHFTFCLNLIAQTQFVVVFFSKIRSGMIFAVIFFLALFFSKTFALPPNNFYYLKVYDRESNLKAALSPHAAFTFVLDVMMNLEGIDKGLDFQTINEIYMNYRMVDSFGFLYLLLFGTIIVTWYLSSIFPNEFGTRKHPFFFLKSKNKKKNELIQNPEYLNLQTERENIEGLDEEMMIREEKGEIVSLTNITKKYNKSLSPAVSNLSLKMYQDQIFVLLGHNGAGKSTTISMLTGLLPITSGSAKVFGHDVETDMSEIRQFMGVCPQYDILYDQLTVYEHLELFAIFKGVKKWQISAEISKIAKDLYLSGKLKAYTSSLSGGQKRRLSLGIALIGNSKFILLDEPTSGMDSTSRHVVWEILKNNKQERIILLTTHFMDEADFLGDRIAIISEGSLKCVGSSVFLKNKFGIGYNLTISRKNNVPLDKHIKEHIPEANLIADNAGEISYQLPMNSLSNFQALFEFMDENLDSLGIASYGISITTLEEVFLTVADGKDPTKKITDHLTNRTKLETEDMNNGEAINIESKPFTIFTHFQHFLAIFQKKFLYSFHDWRGLCLEIVLPCVMLLITIFITSSPQRSQSPSRKLIPSLYGNLKVATAGNAGNIIAGLKGKGYSVKDMSGASLVQMDDFLFGNPDYKAGIYVSSGGIADNADFDYSVLYKTNSPELGALIISEINTIVLETLCSCKSQITAVNAPVPFTFAQFLYEDTIDSSLGILIFGVGFSFLPAAILSFVVNERIKKIKHMQIISGASIGAYWCGNLVGDFIKYEIVAIFFCAILKAFDVGFVAEEDNFGPIFGIFALSGFPIITFFYSLSFYFSEIGNSHLSGFMITYFLGPLLALICSALRFLGGTRNFSFAIKHILRLIPSFALFDGIHSISNRKMYGQREGNIIPLEPLHEKIALLDLIYLVWTGIFYFFLIFVLEYIYSHEALLIRIRGFWNKFKTCIKLRKSSKIEKKENTFTYSLFELEEDVANEALKVENSSKDEFLLSAKKVQKIYDDGKHAVKGLSVGIKPGECFGLLGINGAGKTSSFKMITGDESITGGEIRIKGLDLSREFNTIRKNIGYCPQFDALLDNLTVEEHLRLYCKLRGIPSTKVRIVVQEKLYELNLEKYRKYLTTSLSGGNKRKLSVAIATLGSPQIILLDEPSTGMDPEARRFMWNVISKISNQNKEASVILTTHLMEEAEALCNRLGIMVDGQFQCIGSIQHIKQKYSQGYEIDVKLRNPTQEEVNMRIRATGRRRSSTFKNNEISAVMQQLNMGHLMPEINRRRRGSSIMIEANKSQGCPIELLGEFVLNEERSRETMDYIRERLGQFEIIEHFKNYFRIKFIDPISIGNLFGFFQRNSEIMKVETYSIRQASIEQIFNDFANSRITIKKYEEEVQYSPDELVGNSSISNLSKDPE